MRPVSELFRRSPYLKAGKHAEQILKHFFNKDIIRSCLSPASGARAYLPALDMIQDRPLLVIRFAILKTYC